MSTLYYTIPGIISGPIVCPNCCRCAQATDEYSDSATDDSSTDYTAFISGICKCYVDRKFSLWRGLTSPRDMEPKLLRQEQIFVKEVFKRLRFNLHRMKPGWLILIQSSNDFIPEEIKRKIVICLRNFFIKKTCAHHWDAAEDLIYPTLKFLE